MGKAHLALLYKTACRTDYEALQGAVRLYESGAVKFFGGGWLRAFQYARLLISEEREFCDNLRQAVQRTGLRVKRLPDIKDDLEKLMQGQPRSVWDAPASDLDYRPPSSDNPEKILFVFFRHGLELEDL